MLVRLLACGLLLCAVGCGGGGVVPVSGRVTLDNKPLPNAAVLFQPEGTGANAGPVSEGRTDADGRFTLRTATGKGDGAVVGKHKVILSASEGEPGESNAKPKPRRERLPARYNSQSKLTFEVPAGGTSSANFDLHSK